MKGQTAIEYLMTYGWAILIILIVAGVLAYYGIFAPSGFLGPTARGFGQVQVLNPWSVVGTTGSISLNVENRVGGTINVTAINVTLAGDNNVYQYVLTGGKTITSGTKSVLTSGAPATPSWDSKNKDPSSAYTATITIYYDYGGSQFSSTGTISGTYS